MKTVIKDVSCRLSPRQQAVDKLRSMIAAGRFRPGDRLPAEQALTGMLEVSRTTLRAALAQIEHEGLIRRRKNKGCVVAESASANGSPLMNRTVVLFSDIGRTSDPAVFGGLSDAVHSGILSEFAGSGRNLLVVDMETTDAPRLDHVFDSRPCGALLALWGRHATAETLFQKLATSGIPAAALGDHPELDAFDQVVSDHDAGFQTLTQTLIEAGRRRILRLWTSPPDWPLTRIRDAAFERTLAMAGIPVVPPVVVQDIPGRALDDREAFSRRVRCLAGYLVEHLQGPDPVDAIMVGTDSEVFPAGAACRLFGRESDVVVTGYDHYWENAFERQWEATCPWATVDKNNHRLGEALANLLLKRLCGAIPEQRQVEIIPQQIIRQGVSPRPIHA